MEPKFIQRFDKMSELDGVKDVLLKQQRGNKFEELINDIFAHENTLVRKGYHTSDQQSEQIDGAIEIWHRILLVEVKWVESNVAASELFSFIGKIENKFHGTLGVFISRKELTENFIQALNRGRRQNVIVVHGEDIDLLFQKNSASLSDYIAHCLKLLSYDNKTHFPFRQFMKVYQAPNKLAIQKLQKESDFIMGYLSRTDEVSLDELRSVYEDLPKDVRKGIFMYVLQNFENIWLSESKNHYSERKYNYLRYFYLLNSESEEVLGTEAIYYKEKLASSFGLYGTEDIFKLYVDKFKTLNLDIKVNFEQKLVKEFIEAGKYNNWEKENVMTGIIAKLWDRLEPETRKKLKEHYIYIELDNFRNDNHPQKQFAKKLLVEGIISRTELEEWLLSKLADFIETVGNYEEMDSFFYSTYFGIAKYLGLDQYSFVTFVDGKAKEMISAKQQ